MVYKRKYADKIKDRSERNTRKTKKKSIRRKRRKRIKIGIETGTDHTNRRIKKDTTANTSKRIENVKKIK